MALYTLYADIPIPPSIPVHLFISGFRQKIKIPPKSFMMLHLSQKTKRIFIAAILVIGTLVYFSKEIFWAIYPWYIEPRKARTEIPVTYQVGWWSSQYNLVIDSFRVEIVESNLNLFNDKSLFAYSVFGRLKNQKHITASIKEVHLSERLNQDSTIKIDRIVEITPIVSIDVAKNRQAGEQPFHFRNELNVTSGFWGGNSIKFVCGNKEQVVEFRQRK